MRLPIDSYSHPLIKTKWVDQWDLEIRMMEQLKLFELLFKTAVRNQHILRSLHQKAQILELPQEEGTMICQDLQGNPWEPQGRWDQFKFPSKGRGASYACC